MFRWRCYSSKQSGYKFTNYYVYRRDLPKN